MAISGALRRQRTWSTVPGTGLNSNVDTRRPFDLGAPALAPVMLILVRHFRVRALVCAQFPDCTNFYRTSVFKLTKLRSKTIFCFKWSSPSISRAEFLSVTQTSYSTKFVKRILNNSNRLFAISLLCAFTRFNRIRIFHVAFSGVIISTVQVIEIQLC